MTNVVNKPLVKQQTRTLYFCDGKECKISIMIREDAQRIGMHEEKKCPLQNKVCHTNHRPACTSIKEDTYIRITSFSVRADDIVQSRWTWPRPQFFIFWRQVMDPLQLHVFFLWVGNKPKARPSHVYMCVLLLRSANSSGFSARSGIFFYSPLSQPLQALSLPSSWHGNGIARVHINHLPSLVVAILMSNLSSMR